TELRPDPAPDRLGDLDWRPEESLAARDVGEGLVDREPLDQRCVVADDPDRGVAQPLILLEMAANEDEAGAELACAPARHAAMAAEGLGLVGSREHHAPADGDGLSPERRVE